MHGIFSYTEAVLMFSSSATSLAVYTDFVRPGSDLVAGDSFRISRRVDGVVRDVGLGTVAVAAEGDEWQDGAKRGIGTVGPDIVRKADVDHPIFVIQHGPMIRRCGGCSA
jgi:hypothetical protein